MNQMPNLPMQAFEIKGYGGDCVSLEIGEVFGFPDETSYGGGFGARGQLRISAGSYTVSAMHYFTTGELYGFSEALAQCYERLSGTATLENTERQLDLSCSFDRTGHVILTGAFQEYPHSQNKLIFEIGLDQTFIPSALAQLRAVAQIFGGMRGILN